MAKFVIPSEEYLIAQRIITFLDEWGFYLVLGILYFTQNYLLMLPVFIFGVFAIWLSYKNQWALEARRFAQPEAPTSDGKT